MEWSLCFFRKSSNEHINFAGLPAITEFSGTFFVTTDPAPMIALGPIVTFGRMMVPAPIKQFVTTQP